MKITILSIGSRGDVQPYLALGLGQQKAGHQVTVAVDSLFEDFVVNAGLRFAPATANPMEPMQEDIRAIGSNPNKIFKWMSSYAAKIAVQHFEDTAAACEGADLIFTSSVSTFSGLQVASAMDTLFLGSTLQPAMDTRYYPYSTAGILPEWLPFWGAINKFMYRFNNKLARRMFMEMINIGRKEVLGMPPLDADYYTNADLSIYPFLNAYSPNVIPKPPDWDENQIITGYWFLDQTPKEWQPDLALVDFLETKPRPVYIGFGSMVDKEADELTRLVVEALEMAGQRAVLLGGWTDLGGAGLPDNIFKVDSVPHEWLFPRVAAVVHHGGAGTTAAGLRAGVPTVVVPFFADQPFWGWRVEKLGVGPKPIPRLKLTAKKLAAAISQAVGDEDMASNAAALGEKIRREDGVAEAVRMIEYLVENRRESLTPDVKLKTGGR